MVDATIQTAAVAGLEAAVNRALALDPSARQELGKLQGAVFQLSCSKPELELFLLPQTQSVRLTSLWDGAVTSAIKGTAQDFAELASSQDPAAALINGRLELHGDSGPLLELQAILRQTNMDWEAPLVDAFGDVVGHQLAQGFRGLFGWSKQAAGSIGRQLEEFITEEARLTPPRQEVEDFYQDINALNLRVERLQARAKKLAQVIANTQDESL